VLNDKTLDVKILKTLYYKIWDVTWSVKFGNFYSFDFGWSYWSSHL